MAPLSLAVLVFCAGATLLHLVSTGVMIYRCRKRSSPPHTGFTPAVTILRPLCGVDPLDELTLRSGFELTYPNYDLIFCCAQGDDPVIPLVKRLIAEHPHVPAQLLIGEDKSTPNPKLGNLIKGWHAARSPWIVMADSNVLMPPDYIDEMLRGWRPDTGLMCSPPIGCMPQGFWAELECAFLNGFQARWQYMADAAGLGFAQGKSMLWRRADLELAGGIRVLAGEIAEDAAATKLVRELGLRVRLVRAPFGQPLGRRAIAQVWARQLRWARLRRATFPAFFIPELFAGSLLPILAGGFAASELGLSPWAVCLALGAVWLGSEALLTRAAGWHLSFASPFAWALRDLVLPILWANAWTGNSFTWRGNRMHLDDAPSEAASAVPVD
jgi:ceramide glucosyltransferase